MKKHFNKTLSFRYKILLYYIFLVIIPLLISSFLVISRVSKVMYSKGHFIANQNLLQIKDEIDSYCENIEHLSYDIVFNTEIKEMVKHYDPDRFFTLRSEYKVFGDLFGLKTFDLNKILFLSMRNTHGQEIFSLGTVHKKSTLNDESFLTSNINHYWSDVYKSSLYTSNKAINVISFYRKAIDINNYEAIGTLKIDIDEESIKEIYKDILLTPNSQVLIVDENTNNIISSTNSSHISMDVGSAFGHAISTPNNNGKFVTKLNNIEYLITYSTLDFSHWKLIYLIPTSDLNKDVEALKDYILIIIFIIIIFAIILSYLFSMSITKPIYRLISSMEEVEKGNLNASFSTTTNDEIALLGDSFNNMVAETKQLVERIYEINAEKEISETLYLQSQINPHFLYNTLDSIRWMARKNKDYEVSEQIEALSNLFRHVLNNGNRFTKFKDEIEHINNYMTIQLKRFDEQISINITMAEEILELYTVNLLLQPLVENSIVHGLENKLDDGYIEIKGHLEDNTVLIEVIDNGAGTDQEEIRDMINSNEESTKYSALKNLDKRIKLYFGNEYGLEFYSQIGQGTRVLLILPVLNTIPEWRDLYETSDSR